MPYKTGKSSFDYKFRHSPRKEGEALFHQNLIGEDDLSDDQRDAYSAVTRWMRGREESLLTMGGYAGTGKSTLLALLAYSYPNKKIAFCAYTGKAAGVLRQKIFPTGGAHKHYIGTIHRLIYFPLVDPKTGEVIRWCRKPDLEEYDLIVVDEASMIDELLYNDIVSYGIPVLAVGDHGQLPPVMGDFNLMESPQLRLERIHRQAENNPIIKLSAYVREHGDLPENAPQGILYICRSDLRRVLTRIYGSKELNIHNAAFLAGTNRTRQEVNTTIRNIRFSGQCGPKPVVGDQLICLKNAKDTVFNGMRGHLENIAPYERSSHHYRASIRFPDDEIEFEGPISVHQFGRLRTFSSFDELAPFGLTGVKDWEEVGLLLDYGYAMTVHKAQGSSFECVVLLYERLRGQSSDEFRRWLYTGVTRCADVLIIVLPD
jgi:exodeoxyribonuclease-5